MSGRVTETAPTPTTGIAGAVITIADGTSAGRTAVANAHGFYSISGIVPGSRAHVSAPGYLAAARDLGIELGQSNFQLMPILKTETAEMIDTLDAQVGRCNDGVAQRPCHIMVFPVHNEGSIDAMLTWSSSGVVNMDLALFQTGSPTPIARGAGGEAGETIQARVPGGSTYELRVSYVSGSAPAHYTLRTTHPN